MSIEKSLKIYKTKLEKSCNDLNFNTKKLKEYLVGKKITINDEKFNGQPYGTSKPSMKGKSWIFEDCSYLRVDTFNGDIYVCHPDACPIRLARCLVERIGE